MTEPYVSKIDRRTTLAWLSATGVAATGAFARKAQAAALPSNPVATRGYGTDPLLTKPAPAPWPRILTKPQLQTAAMLCDVILPASATAPSASAVGVPDFIDEWVSAPYPDQAADRPVIVGGLDWIEAYAGADRAAVLQSLAIPSSDAAMRSPQAFFRRFRSLTIGAYYTTQPGFKDIGYIGNVARTRDPGPSPEVKAHLDRELKKLGL